MTRPTDAELAQQQRDLLDLMDRRAEERRAELAQEADDE